MASVWIGNPFDNLPEEGARAQRYASLAAELAGRGHDVVWWTASFSHSRKDVRRAVDGTPLPAAYDRPDGSRLRLVPTPPYRSNVGLARIRSHRAFAANWRAAAEAAVASGETIGRRRYLDLTSFHASAPLGINPPELLDDPETLAELEAMDDRYLQEMPPVQELARMYGDPQNQQLFRIRDLALIWQQRHIAETGNRIYDMHDETHSFSVHLREDELLINRMVVESENGRNKD